MSSSYTPSRLLPGDGALLREHAFTHWMSRDLMQAATDFFRNVGLLPIYGETDAEERTRYLLWQAPKGWACEVRTGRTHEQFLKFDAANVARDWPLLTLHINAAGFYSAVWLAPNHGAVAREVLAGYGITPASRAA